MTSRMRTWMWVSTALSSLVGLLLVWNDSAVGWFLIIMGAVYLGMLTRPGQGLAVSNPGLVKWGLAGVSGLLILLAAVLGALALFR